MRHVLVATTALLLSAPAAASNFVSVFQDAPITRLSAPEVKEFEAFVFKALDEGKEGATLEWKAPKTVFTSKVTPGKSFDDGKLKCREATVESDAYDRSQRGLYTFCKTAKGGWGFKSPPKPQAAKK